MRSKDSILSKCKLNKISEVETDKLSDFYKKIYFERYKSLTNNWRWWYRVGLFNSEPIVLTLDDKVIGQAAFLPTELNILEKKIPAIWFQDYAVLPQFKGKGLGSFLCKEWMKICPNQMAICSPDSLRVLKKLGWKDNFETERLVRPISFTKFVPVIKNLNLNFIDSFTRYIFKKRFERKVVIKPYNLKNNFKRINDLFSSRYIHKNKEFAEIIRDEKWFHWRLMECPYKDNLFFFEYKNNFSIAHIYKVKKINRINILYTFNLEKDNLENELIVLILNWALNNNKDLIWGVSRSSKFDNIYPKSLKKPLRFAAWSKDEKMFDVLKNGFLDFQGIDSDKESSIFVE